MIWIPEIVVEVRPNQEHPDRGQFLAECQILQLPYFLIVDRHGKVSAHGIVASTSCRRPIMPRRSRQIGKI